MHISLILSISIEESRKISVNFAYQNSIPEIYYSNNNYNLIVFCCVA